MTEEVLKPQQLQLEEKWDKVFPRNEKVEHKKVTFLNHFGITLAGDLYYPKGVEGKLPALSVCGPFGAVKEQSSGLYAQEFASRGFVTIAFDPSFTGESGGLPRYMNSPDINTEDYMASIDFLSSQSNVDPNKIGIIGICGWGGISVNTASIDVRIKATVSITMYDMSRISANGYFDHDNNLESRRELRKNVVSQRVKEFVSGKYNITNGGLPDVVPDEAPEFVKQYFGYYKTKRGYHPRSLNSNNGWSTCTGAYLLNTKLLAYANEIENAVMIVHGEKAHSRYMGEDTFKLLKGDNKKLVIVPGANHVDLYDNYDKIPFDTIQEFFKQYLN